MNSTALLDLAEERDTLLELLTSEQPAGPQPHHFEPVVRYVPNDYGFISLEVDRHGTLGCARPDCGASRFNPTLHIE